eukprot:m.135878 g.135878  ORF g.135878 m.135878 type:complete len:399 (-) comp14717_c0_seq1:106-1302(-)
MEHENENGNGNGNRQKLPVNIRNRRPLGDKTNVEGRVSNFMQEWSKRNPTASPQERRKREAKTRFSIKAEIAREKRQVAEMFCTTSFSDASGFQLRQQGEQNLPEEEQQQQSHKVEDLQQQPHKVEEEQQQRHEVEQQQLKEEEDLKRQREYVLIQESLEQQRKELQQFQKQLELQQQQQLKEQKEQQKMVQVLAQQQEDFKQLHQQLSSRQQQQEQSLKQQRKQLEQQQNELQQQREEMKQLQQQIEHQQLELNQSNLSEEFISDDCGGYIEVEPGNTLDDEVWFFGQIKLCEAGNYLEYSDTGTFLIREDVFQPGVYLICLNNQGEIWECNIKQKNTGEYYIEEDVLFSNLQAFVQFYAIHPGLPVLLTHPYRPSQSQKEMWNMARIFPNYATGLI